MALVKADLEGISIFSMSKESVVISDAYSIFARSLKRDIHDDQNPCTKCLQNILLT